MTTSTVQSRRIRGAVLDLQAALVPSGGLIAAHAVASPAEAGGMWRVTARLLCRHSDQPWTTQLQSCVTGACSLNLRDAMVRAVGESVERIALHPTDHEVPATLSTDALGVRALRLRRADGALADPDPAAPLHWYAGRRLHPGSGWAETDHDGRADPALDHVQVPAGLVEYPAVDPDLPATVTGFDQGPSGAAAGLGRAAALRGALLEVIERDALIVAWARQLRTRSVDLDDLLRRAGSGPAGAADWRPVDRLRRLILDRGMRPVVAEVGLTVPGLVCVVGGVLAQTSAGPAYCLGVKVSDDPARAVRGALEESLQLAPGLIELREARRSQPPPAEIRGENDRLEFLASDAGAASVAAWLGDPASSSLPLGLPPVSTRELLARAIADGLEPVALDLTHRLPDPARAAGWSVIKVIPAGYQPLRVDERTSFGWNTERLRTAPARTGLAARVPPGEVHPDPHPLP